jgi:hypothetical protein
LHFIAWRISILLTIYDNVHNTVSITKEEKSTLIYFGRFYIIVYFAKFTFSFKCSQLICSSNEKHPKVGAVVVDYNDAE